MRRVLFWMHLTAGVLASLLILFFSITGSLLAFERQIVAAADRSYGDAKVLSSGGPAVATETLLSAAVQQIPGPVQTITRFADSSAYMQLETDQHDVYLVDPYSGQVCGPASPRTRAFFLNVTALHRWFGLGKAHHAGAIAVKGATTLLLLFLIASGALLWVPRKWNRATLVSGIQPRLHAQGRARNYNWHKVTGFWLGLPLAIMVTTGAVMAYPWANALLFRIAGTPVPVRAQNAQRASHGARPAIPADLDRAFTAAVSSVPDWRMASLHLTSGRPSLSFTVDQGNGGEPERRVQVVIDSSSLTVLQRTPFANQPRGQRWRGWVRFVHTGEAGGWWGEMIAFVTALGAIVLSVTGLLLSLPRLRRSCIFVDRASL